MIRGDAGVEAIFYWDAKRKGVDRRGAGPMDASLFGRGAGEGLGVHICTGPVAVKGAEPGDVLEVRILDVQPRPCKNPKFPGKAFGSNAAAWWGFHYKDLIEEPSECCCGSCSWSFRLKCQGGQWRYIFSDFCLIPRC